MELEVWSSTISKLSNSKLKNYYEYKEQVLHKANSAAGGNLHQHCITHINHGSPVNAQYAIWQMAEIQFKWRLRPAGT